MAYINVDEVYILDNTGLQVDMATDIPFVDAGFTDAQKEQARKNIAAGGTNPNLLDNAYFVGGGSQLGEGKFPINQRGQSSYSGGYGIDRWRCWQASTVTLSATGLTFATGTNGDGLFQYFTQGFYESLYGKTVTVSAIINGQLYSVTGTASADCWITTQFDGDNYIGYICNGNEANFRISLNGGGRSATIQAVKLELGTVSTLANDPPPDFGDELLKCQRYLYVLNAPTYHFLGEVALAGDATNCTISFHLPAEMRTTAPSVTLTSGLWVGGAQTTAVNWTRTLGTTVIAAFTVTGGLSGSTLYAVATGASATTITISAEL